MSELETQIEAGQEAIRETTGLLSRMLDQLTARLPSILVALVVFVLGMLLATLINKTIFHTMKRAKLNKTAASFGRSLVRILLYTILLMICLSIAGLFLRLGYIAKTEGDIAARQTQLSLAIAYRTMTDLPAAFSDEPQALAYIDEAVENARADLEDLGLAELLGEAGGD